MNANYKIILKSLRQTALALTLIAIMTLPSFAADVYLVAKEFVKAMPDGANITMWGFVEDSDGDLNTIGVEIPTVPGPVITVSPADPMLTIHLRNDLTVDTSIIIPGQPAAMTPVFFLDGQSRERVSSFTHVTGSNGDIQAYTWTNLKPGTFLYHSGTHVAVQVQMGLYGGIKKDAAVGEAYSSTATVDASYDAEVVLFFSEIDPALHAAVANGDYGTPAYPSTLNYKPKYFLVNGEPYHAGQVALPAGTVGQNLLIRYLNAGLRTLVPTLSFQNISHEDQRVIAEDGNLYPYARKEFSLLLPAGQTKDGILVVNASGNFVVYDRRGYLTTDEAGYGGMLVNLEVGP